MSGSQFLQKGIFIMVFETLKPPCATELADLFITRRTVMPSAVRGEISSNPRRRYEP